ncbi:unnamed protein product, partial [Polarella glacialis]
ATSTQSVGKVSKDKKALPTPLTPLRRRSCDAQNSDVLAQVILQQVYHAAAYDQPSEISKSLSQSSASSVCSTTTSSVEVVTEKQNVASTAPAAARRKKTVSAPVARAAAPAKHQPPSAPSVRKAERRRPQRATGDATPQGSLWQS